MLRRSIGRSLLSTLFVAACSGESPAGDAGVRPDVTAIDTPSPIDTPPSTDLMAPLDVVDAGAPIDASPDAPIDVTLLDAPADGAAPTDSAATPTGTLRDVRHVVIFMQENRSFDNYFGALSGVRGFGDPAAMTLRSGRSVFHQPSGAGEVLPFHTPLDCVNDVDHGWASGHDAWHNGLWDRWIPAKGPTRSARTARAELSYYYALADAYTVLDAYHCSVMGPTNPNRLYLMTGMIDPTGPAADR
jgi:hypothetical protein